jgi:hypothetical protein
MITIKNFALMFCLTFCFAVIANAQTINSGTVDFSVTTPAAFDLRGNGASTAGNGVQIQTNSNTNTSLSVNLVMGDAGPGNSNAMTASVPLRLRSNAPYKLTAVRTGENTQVDNDAAAFDASDITVGITVVRNAGGLVASGADIPNAAVTKLSNIDKITGSTTLMTGDRISNQGSNSMSSNNYITATLQFNATHQYYSVGTYSEQITLGISANP